MKSNLTASGNREQGTGNREQGTGNIPVIIYSASRSFGRSGFDKDTLFICPAGTFANARFVCFALTYYVS
ncbi:hypothetical protein DP116_20500 [Brasilonema bromeliae SPC951]|uniref:Uncharacterized protein n=1 Tax=Brasilonema bromeliae SPC951 TaxID=385972 RepID=A0ABX1PE72_9CYAN|nr:hypothetical protein [Brasilonema bromeliae SPC951]